jgi:CheY-like chemotaxis protein
VLAKDHLMKILVVDDHPLVRDAMAELVTHLGGSVDVLQAADCNGALALARVHPDLDLVLLDLNLPGLRGIPGRRRFHSEIIRTRHHRQRAAAGAGWICLRAA